MADLGEMARARRGATLAKLAYGFACLLAAAPSCGYDDPGSGSQSVKLVGSLECTYPSLESHAHFLLTRDAQPLLDANITLIDADSHERLQVPATAEQGVYTATWPGYHRRVQVHVWQEKDGMTFQLEGPSQHTLDSPRPGTLVKFNEGVKVRWRSPDGVRADEAAVRIDGVKPATRLGRDGGKARFTAREFGRGNQVLTVSRSRHLQPQGGSPGSRMSSSYSVSTPFVRLSEH